MEDYKKGKEDGKKSVKKTMILSTFLSVLGLVFVYSNKPVRSMFKEHSDQYFDGYYKGVMERRWGYWWLGWIPVLIFISMITSITS